MAQGVCAYAGLQPRVEAVSVEELNKRMEASLGA